MKTILYARSAYPNPEAIRQQLEKMESFAADMMYTDCVHIIDDGKSGTGINDLHERPGLCQMMEAVISNEVANVIVTNFSRLSRNMKVFTDIIATLNDWDVRLIAIEEDYDSMADKYKPYEPFIVTLESLYKEMQYRNRHRMEYTRWGRMHEYQLREKRPALYNNLRECSRLNDYLDIISDTADHRVRKLLQDMRVQEGLPERPDSDDKGEWKHRMDELYKKAALIVKKEIIEL